MLVTWQVIWRAFKILITECKKDRLEQGEGQAFAQTAAARDEYVRRKVTGTKRKPHEIDADLPVGYVPNSLAVCPFSALLAIFCCMPHSPGLQLAYLSVSQKEPRCICTSHIRKQLTVDLHPTTCCSAEWAKLELMSFSGMSQTSRFCDTLLLCIFNYGQCMEDLQTVCLPVFRYPAQLC